MATATRRTRRQFDDDFKRKAVALSASIGRKAALAQLDIYGSVLDAWVKRFGSTNGSPTPAAEPHRNLGNKGNRGPRAPFRPSYPAQERAKAIALAKQIGDAAAAKELSISRRTLYEWRTKGGWQPRKRGRPLGSRDTVKRIRTVSTYPNRMSGILTELDHQADLADQKITDVLSAYRLGIHEGVKLVLSLSSEDKD